MKKELEKLEWIGSQKLPGKPEENEYAFSPTNEFYFIGGTFQYGGINFPLRILFRLKRRIQSINERSNIKVKYCSVEKIELGNEEFIFSKTPLPLKYAEDGKLFLPFKREFFEELFGRIIKDERLPQMPEYQYVGIWVDSKSYRQEYPAD